MTRPSFAVGSLLSKVQIGAGRANVLIAPASYGMVFYLFLKSVWDNHFFIAGAMLVAAFVYIRLCILSYNIGWRGEMDMMHGHFRERDQVQSLVQVKP